MFKWLRSLVTTRATPNNPSFGLNDPAAWDSYWDGPQVAGVRVNLKTAQGFAPFFRAQTLIASTVAKLPLLVYENLNEGGRTKAKDHSAYPLLRYKANAEQSAFVFWQTIVGNALARGNGYAYIYRETSGVPSEMVLLDPDKTTPIRVNGRLWYIWEDAAGKPHKLDAADVLHIKGFSDDGLTGIDIVSKFKETLGLGIGTIRYQNGFYANNSRPSCVIQCPSALKPDQVTRFLADWERMFQGLGQSHRTAVLHGGATLKELTMTARDTQLVETRKLQARDVAVVFGIPPHKLGDDSKSSYNSLEQENQSFLDECLDPWLVQIEQETRDKLLSEEEKANDSHHVEYLRSALVRANLAVRYQAYSIGIQNGFLTRNEARAAENLNPLDGLDEPLTPLNMATDGNTDQIDDDQPADDTVNPPKGTPTDETGNQEPDDED